ncbi:hypothetical protein C2W64_02161 [Brevibacillus laterosporus]|nr:hypothetical protein [Brevibacillus laterosporus]RAP26145.1 hypothetical protein C2W64_02161 [Brevibacillus laterosporus]
MLFGIKGEITGPPLYSRNRTGLGFIVAGAGRKIKMGTLTFVDYGDSKATSRADM